MASKKRAATKRQKTSKPEDLSDELLVERVIEDDIELYRHVVERYQAPLIRYARSIVYELEPAEDVVQNVFIKAYRNLRGFNTKLKFSSWIYRITHNEAVDYLKKHSRELRPDDEDWMSRQMDTSELIDTHLNREDDRKMVVEQLAKLDVKYREPLTLSALEGKSYQEISDILRIPSATVGTRINRAKLQLKAAIESHENSPTKGGTK